MAVAVFSMSEIFQTPLGKPFTPRTRGTAALSVTTRGRPPHPGTPATSGIALPFPPGFSTCNGYSKFIWRIIQRQHWRHSGPESRPGIPPPWGVTLSRDRHVTLRSGSSISIVGIPMVPTVAANGRNVGIRRLNLVGRDRPGTPGRACHGLVGSPRGRLRVPFLKNLNHPQTSEPSHRRYRSCVWRLPRGLPSCLPRCEWSCPYAADRCPRVLLALSCFGMWHSRASRVTPIGLFNVGERFPDQAACWPLCRSREDFTALAGRSFDWPCIRRVFVGECHRLDPGRVVAALAGLAYATQLCGVENFTTLEGCLFIYWRYFNVFAIYHVSIGYLSGISIRGAGLIIDK